MVEGLSVDLALPHGTLHAVSDVQLLGPGRGNAYALSANPAAAKTITSLALMQLLPRQAHRTARTLQLEGRDLRNASEKEMALLRGYRIGMIFQDPMTSLNPVYTIGNQLEEVYLRHRHSSRAEARERAEYLLARVASHLPPCGLRNILTSSRAVCASA